MKRRNILLAALAMTLVLSMSIGPAFAYFTTSTSANGSFAIDVKSTTDITEQFDSWTKHVAVTNDEGSEPVYVRARAFADSDHALTYSGTGWTAGTDGWYYYSAILEGGQSTGELLVAIGGIPENPEDGDNFNVVVVYEATPVRYNADGSAQAADWTVRVNAADEQGGN